MLLKQGIAPLCVALLMFLECLLPIAAWPATPGTAIDVPVLPAPPSMSGTVDASWSKAESLTLDMDFTYHRAATEATTVYVGQENGYLDIAFVATQRETITQAQVTNGSSVVNDDYVEVALNPQGTHGFAYAFYANPRGARFQTSSENTAYTPEWSAVGVTTPKGYGVTMRIPLRVIRNGGSSTWRAQFIRYTIATNGLAVWTYAPDASNITDASFYGVLRNVGAQGPTKTRPQPRVQPYALGELTPKWNGGDTSRVGLDASLPITPTASFVTSLHPDYSNVEIDQQTIAPTAFARQYQEVRPFFTQAGSFFNQTFSCNNCPESLYTPSIPVFSQGYAVEGTQGPVSFGAYDAIGDARTDDAAAATYSLDNTSEIESISLQRVAADLPGIEDDTTTMDTGYLNQQSHFGAYFNFGMDRGTLVTDPQEANYFEGGPFYNTATTSVGIIYQRIGSQYDPLDGYVPINNVAGYEIGARRTWNFSPSSLLHDITTFDEYSRYGNDEDEIGETLSYEQVNFDLRDLLTLQLVGSSEGVRTSDAEFLPFNGNSVLIGYRYGATNQSSATSTNTPSYIEYQSGLYYHGMLDAWTYLTTLQLAPRFHLTLQDSEDRYESVYTGEETTTQWLERASLDWQINRWMQFDVGVRRIIGPNLPNAYQTLALETPALCENDPYYPGCSIEAGNVSLALHFLEAHNEFYLVYGDPNDLSTLPALYFKWIRYIGAEKGT